MEIVMPLDRRLQNLQLRGRRSPLWNAAEIFASLIPRRHRRCVRIATIMPRKPRYAPGGYVYHVLNRGIAKTALFETRADRLVFERLLFDAPAQVPMRILTHCVMRNHWHLLLWPESDGILSAFMQWLTSTHAKRWHADHGTSGCGALYQSRFKSVTVQTDSHLVWAWRYVERNPVRANLVLRAEDWRWSGAWHRRNSDAYRDHASPIPLPDDWLTQVNLPQTAAELDAFRHCIRREWPFGTRSWALETAMRLGLEKIRWLPESPLVISTRFNRDDLRPQVRGI